MKLVRLALPVPLARLFDYLLPEGCQPPIGARVVVPFGKQTKIGVVVDFPCASEVETAKLKPIDSVLDNEPLFEPEMWQLLKWAANYYHAPLGEVLHSALPAKLRQGEAAQAKRLEHFTLTEAGKHALHDGSLTRAKQQLALLNTLAGFAENFLKPTACSPSAWKGLLQKGLIAQVAPLQNHQSWQAALGEKALCNTHNRLTLNKQQSLVVGRLTHQQGFGAFLLYGVTGAGKTEVYLQVIEQVLEQGRQVLVLVPEIGLTPQTIARFQARFNVEIDVLHSELNDSQRLNVWLRAKNGESAIVIGTRSALFTQFKQLGLIILDEEHDSSFKQQEGWRYHARDLALVRAKNAAIPIILGSATPSLESLHNAHSGKFTLLSLPARAGNARFATEQIIDLKTERVFGGLSETLLRAIQHQLERGNQVMLFLNRRGFAPVLLCHECGWVCECTACEKPYTYHQKSRILRCHHCASQRAIPRQCGHCGSTHLITTGIGTEQLEQVLSQRFPHYRTTRIDRDSTAAKGSLEQHLRKIQAGESQILIGTQMLAKGHHFPNVTLVAIVNVDSALFSTDFRAEERLAQLYTQVAGRAGRAEKQGEVWLQTHYPHHPLLTSLVKEGYLAFAEHALQLRKLTTLPPFSGQALVRASGRNEAAVAEFLQKLTACLQQIIADQGWQGFQLLGPFNAPMAKKAGHFRQLLLLQHPQRAQLQQLLTRFDLQKDGFLRHDVRFSVDIDPQELA